MSLNAAALRLLAEKGLSAADIVELAECLEVRRDPTAAERMRRMRAKRAERVTVTRNVTDEPSPNDINSNPSGFDGSSEPSAVSDFSIEVVGIWNRERAGTPLPEARKLTSERRKHLNARIKAHGKEAVATAIRNMAQSDFHSGRSGIWTEGNLGWLLKSDENFVKMLERQPAQSAGSKPISAEERQRIDRFKADREAYERGEMSFDEMMARKLRPPDDAPRKRTGPVSIGQIADRIVGDQAA